MYNIEANNNEEDMDNIEVERLLNRRELDDGTVSIFAAFSSYCYCYYLLL